MKKTVLQRFFLQTIFLSSVSLLFAPAMAANWVEQGVSRNNRIMMDSDSVKFDENKVEVKAWFREASTAPRKDNMGNTFHTTVTLEIFQCAKRLSAVERVIYYSDLELSDQVVSDVTIPSAKREFVLVIPGSLGEMKMKGACAGSPNKGKQ